MTILRALGAALRDDLDAPRLTADDRRNGWLWAVLVILVILFLGSLADVRL